MTNNPDTFSVTEAMEFIEQHRAFFAAPASIVGFQHRQVYRSKLQQLLTSQQEMRSDKQLALQKQLRERPEDVDVARLKDVQHYYIDTDIEPEDKFTRFYQNLGATFLIKDYSDQLKYALNGPTITEREGAFLVSKSPKGWWEQGRFELVLSSHEPARRFLFENQDHPAISLYEAQLNREQTKLFIHIQQLANQLKKVERFTESKTEITSPIIDMKNKLHKMGQQSLTVEYRTVDTWLNQNIDEIKKMIETLSKEKASLQAEIKNFETWITFLKTHNLDTKYPLSTQKLSEVFTTLNHPNWPVESLKTYLDLHQLFLNEFSRLKSMNDQCEEFNATGLKYKADGITEGNLIVNYCDQYRIQLDKMMSETIVEERKTPALEVERLHKAITSNISNGEQILQRKIVSRYPKNIRSELSAMIQSLKTLIQTNGWDKSDQLTPEGAQANSFYQECMWLQSLKDYKVFHQVMEPLYMECSALLMRHQTSGTPVTNPIKTVNPYAFYQPDDPEDTDDLSVFPSSPTTGDGMH